MLKQIKNFLIMTLSITIMAIGVYYFKFPNNFTFGGVTGAAVVFAKITPLSASMFSTIVNMLLLVVGFSSLAKTLLLRPPMPQYFCLLSFWCLKSLTRSLILSQTSQCLS